MRYVGWLLVATGGLVNADTAELAKVVATNASQKAVLVTEAVLDAVVLAKGEVGSGTAFLAKQDGKIYLFSNVHVLMGNRGVKFTNARNTQFKPLSIEAASDRDLVRITVANPPADALAITEPKSINTPLAVCGNAGGEDVVRPIEGMLVGIGPKKVETDALFIGGHSGSPMITDEGVVGIATYVMRGNEDWVSTNTPFTVVRRFGYRLDNVPSWVKVSTEWFVRESKTLTEREAVLTYLSAMLQAWSLDPYWVVLPEEKELPTPLGNWVKTHNQTVAENNRRLQSGSGSQGRAVAISRAMRQQFRQEADTLMALLTQMTKTPTAKWHLQFFDDYWKDMDKWTRMLQNATEKLASLHTTYDPVVLE